MGYYSSVYGELTPDTPLDNATLDKIKEIYDDNEYEISYAADFVLEDTSAGPENFLRGTLDFSPNEAFKLYDGAEIVTSFIQQVKEETGVTYSGTLHIEGEENDDIWRIVVKNSDVFTHRPRIVWEDEDMEQVL